jgi:hypothetical protein
MRMVHQMIENCAGDLVAGSLNASRAPISRATTYDRW